MKLLSLEIKNFRQFYGDQEAEFASGETEQNITVFHGFNGAGKTALLNAFVWCLYAKVTEDFENPDRLENERAVALAGVGSEVRVSVCLRFEVKGEKWRVERSRVSVKGNDGTITRKSETVALQKVHSSGEFEDVNPESARQDRIDQILPETLYPFFFFNGERVERLAREDAYDQVESGIKTLLDIERYERGARHLRKDVRQVLTEELKTSGDVELEQAQKREAELNRAEDEQRSAIERNEANIRASNEEIRVLEERQAAIQEVDQLTKERERLRAEEKRLRERIAATREELARRISRNGYLAFAPQALDVTEREIDAARTKGHIPAKIKPHFVSDLLTDGTCICGQPILPGSSHEDSLLKWKHLTGLADLEDQIIQVKSGVSRLRERRNDLFEQLDKSVAELSGLGTELSHGAAALSAVEEKLGDRRLNEDAAQLQEAIHRAQRQKDTENQQLGVARNVLQQILDGLEAIKDKIQKFNTRSEQGKLVQRQLRAVENVAKALDEIARIQKDDVRGALDEQIAEIWRDAAIRDYTASVTSDYRLQLTKLVDGRPQLVTGASTGEKQVLALSFVASLVRKARENAEKDAGLGSTGGYYPIVMDSPFGSLEDHYRAKIAHWLPTLTKQVVVMASNTQWRVEVETEMRAKIGREYVLELHTPKPGQDRDIDVDGKSVPYVRSTKDATEMTLIRRV